MHIFLLYYCTGVGLFANDNPVGNNSAIIANSNNDIGTLYCSSGARSSSIGQWFAPDGSEISTSGTGSFIAVHGVGNLPSYVSLQLIAGRNLAASDEGVYTCIIPDENSVQQILYYGLYQNGFRGEFIAALHAMIIKFLYIIYDCAYIHMYSSV